MTISDPLTPRLCDLVSQGHTTEQAAAACQLSRSAAYRRIRSRIGLCRPRIDDAERRKILRLINDGHSRRQVARTVDRSVSTVVRIAHAADDGPKRTKKPERCPTCGGKVMLLPCVRCAATQAIA